MPVTINGSGTMGTMAQGGITGSATIISGTAVASTSGTSIDFTGIPSWVRRITVMFNGVSLSGTSGIRIQLGTSSGVETTGYLGTGATYTSGAAVVNSTSGIDLFNSLINAAEVVQGLVTICLLGSNAWVALGGVSASNEPRIFEVSGSKTVSGTLDRVRITTVNGTDTFDAGAINILYE